MLLLLFTCFDLRQFPVQVRINNPHFLGKIKTGCIEPPMEVSQILLENLVDLGGVMAATEPGRQR